MLFAFEFFGMEIPGSWIFIGGLLFAAYCWRLVTRNLVKIEQGNALVISHALKPNSMPKVSFTGGVVFPLWEKAEMMDISVKTLNIDRRGHEGLICQDNIRADIRVSFYVKIKREVDDVLNVAQSVGCDRASDPQVLDTLFAAKFSEALKTVGKQMDFEELYTKREVFRNEIIKVIGTDLNGYYLEDAAIDYLEQTPIENLDPDNVLDAQGIRKITELTSEQHIHTNKLRQTAKREVEKENADARTILLDLERQVKDKEAEQQKLVSSFLAVQQSETRSIQAEEMAKAERARIEAEEQIAISNENKQREVEVAQKNRERIIAVETERVEKDRALEAIQRERETELRKIEKEREIEIERKNIQDVIAERVAVEKNVAQEEERIKELRLLEQARREKEAKIIAAQATAEEQAVEHVRRAEAAEIVARSNAKARLTQVEAELEAADRQAQAKIRLAEGVQAERAAEGLAEARVKEAMALAHEKEGLAKARVLEAQAPAEEKSGMARVSVSKAEYETEAFGTREKLTAEAEGTRQKMTAEAEGTRLKLVAEAEGIAKKAEAMKALDAVGREHEEFRLKLENDRIVALEQIRVNKDIAEAQASILAEAFRSANIDIIGGDGAFVDKIFQAASVGKSIDAFAKNGELTGALVSDYTNGTRSLAGDIKDALSNVRATDIRNLSLAKLLSRLADDSKGADRVKLRKIMDAVSSMGLADLQLSGSDDLSGEE